MPAAKLVVWKRAKAVNIWVFGGTLNGGADERLFAKDMPQQHLSKANVAFEKAQFVEAEHEYREVLRLAPSDAVAQRQLGLLYFEQGQIRQAFPLLKRAADAEPDNLEVETKLVRSYLAAGEFQRAYDLAQKTIEKERGPGRSADASGRRRHPPEPNRGYQKFLDTGSVKKTSSALAITLRKAYFSWRKGKNQALKMSSMQQRKRTLRSLRARRLGCDLSAHQDLNRAEQEFRAMPICLRSDPRFACSCRIS